MITANVVNSFQENEHDKHYYKTGDTYPAEGFEATKKRVDFLSKLHPTYNRIFLADIEIKKQAQKQDAEQTVDGEK